MAKQRILPQTATMKSQVVLTVEVIVIAFGSRGYGGKIYSIYIEAFTITNSLLPNDDSS